MQSNIAGIQPLNRPCYCFILILILAAAERLLMGLVGNQPLNFELGDGLEILRRRRSYAPAGPVGELGNARLLTHTLVDLVVSGARSRVIRWHALTVLLVQQFHRAFALLAHGQRGRASHHLLISDGDTVLAIRIILVLISRLLYLRLRWLARGEPAVVFGSIRHTLIL